MEERKKVDKSTVTQKKILAAAEKIFGEKGFHGSTTKEIAKEAGIAEGTIFRYFKTKKELLVSLIAPIVLKTAEKLLANKAGKDFEVMLEEILRDRILFIKRFFPIIKVALLEGEIPVVARRKWFDEVVNKVALQVEELIKQQIELGKFRNVDPFFTARMIMILMIGTGVANAISDGMLFAPQTAEDFVPKAIDIFMNGVVEKTSTGNDKL